ncbi:MAG: PHP-associated domain-containing protein [Candidatus Diapherotrites archaeon]
MDTVWTADLHTHLLEYKIKPKAWWKGVQNAGLDVVAMTEHTELKYHPIDGWNAVAPLQPDNVCLIPGAEVMTDYGHVLVYSDSPELYELHEIMQPQVEMEQLLEIAKREKLTVSLSHPFGYDHDSAVFLAGLENVRNIVRKHQIGVEAYNGMIGHLGEFLLSSKWVKRPSNFFHFLERNKVARKTGLGYIGGKAGKKYDKGTGSLVQRIVNMTVFGEEAPFITAGSDAHSADRIGCGMLKLAVAKEVELNPQKFLEELKKKNVLWAGPFVEEVSPGIYEKQIKGLRRGEIWKGLKYVVKRKVKERRKKGEK